MKIQELEPDIRVLTGEAYDSNATLFMRGREALLVDSLASTEDAIELKRHLESQDLHVRWILCTHYFSDHLAGLRFFPNANVVAQQNYAETFHAEEFRTEEETGYFVEPNVVVGDSLQLRWGRYTLHYFANPGHTACSTAIDVPEADLLFGADTTVGNIVYLHYGTPEGAAKALRRLKMHRRARFISGHGGLKNPATVDRALDYLQRLEENVRQNRKQDLPLDLIRLNDCLTPGIEGTDFEEIFHKRNLESIQSRGLFA